MESYQRAVFNFGKRQSLLASKSLHRTLNKCDSECRGTYDFVANTLLEAFKRVLTVNKGKEMGISETDKQLVAYIIWEYMLPAMGYDYVMEKCILPFFLQLSEFHDTNYFDYAVTSLINFCSAEELSEWVAHAFSIITEKIMSFCCSANEKNYLPLLIGLARYQFILSAWLRSENVFADLERVYFFHLASESDLDQLFFLATSPSEINSKTMEAMRKQYEVSQRHLLELTRLLMNEKAVACSNGFKLIPRLIVVSFLDHLIKKNVRYVQEFSGNRHELTQPSAIINFVFSIFSYLESTVLNSAPGQYPFQMLYRADEFPEFVKLDRMGGILSHLLNIYEQERNTKFKKISEETVGASTVFHFSLFNKAIILFNYIAESEFFMAMKIFEKSLEVKQLLEECSEGYQARNKEALEKEIKRSFLQSVPYQNYLFTSTNIRLMKRLSSYILSVTDYIDRKCPELFYFVPNYYNTTTFIIIKNLLRLNLLSLVFFWQNASFKLDLSSLLSVSFNANDPLIDLFISFVTRHLADKRIPNPDQQEDFLIKLLFLLQHKETLRKLDTHPIAREKLLPGLMNAFEQPHILLLAMNFLALLKKDLYNDIETNVGSKFYQEQFAELCKKEGKLFEHFLNSLLNHINDLISKMKLHYAESGNAGISARDRDTHYRKACGEYTTLYRAMRCLELVALLTPCSFVEHSGVFTQRSSDLCMHVVREGIHGQLGKFLGGVMGGDHKKIETPRMLLSPVAGIYLSLNEALKKNKGKLICIEEYIVKADGFELELMSSFVATLKDANPPAHSKFEALANLVGSLESYLTKTAPQVLFRNP